MPQKSAAEILTLPEAAKFLRMSRSHLLNILKGKVRGVPALPYIRVGRRLLFVTVQVPQSIFLDKSRGIGYRRVDECESGSPDKATRGSGE